MVIEIVFILVGVIGKDGYIIWVRLGERLVGEAGWEG